MPKLTKEARERLATLHNVYANRDGAGPARTADDIWTAIAYISALEAERDALKARVAMFQTAGVAELGAHNPDVASYCSEWESRATKAEARVAVLAAECRESRARDEAINGGPQPHYPWPALDEARAATDANGGLDG